MTEERKNMIIGNEVIENKNLGEVREMTYEEWAKIVNEKYDELYKVLEEAALLAIKDPYSQITVYLRDDGNIFIYEHAPNINNPYLLKIYTFEVPLRFLQKIERQFKSMDEEETISILKQYGMSDKDIEDFKNWFYNESAPRKPEDRINILELQYYDYELYDKIFRDFAIPLLDFLFEFSRILSEYEY